MNTTYYLNQVAGNVFGSNKVTPLPTKYYLGLSSTLPKIDGTGVSEPSGGAYTRIEITSLSAPINGAVSNAVALEFPESTTTWGTLPNYVIYETATGGNLLMFGALDIVRIVDVATVILIKPGSITLKIV